MINECSYALGAQRSCIRELYEYGRARAAVVGDENVFDYSLGNPSIPSPPQVNEAIRSVLEELPGLAVHGYTSAVGDYGCRKAIAEDLNRRFGASASPEDLFIGCGAAPELTAVLKALSVPGAQVLALAPYFPEYKPFAEEAGLEFGVVAPDVPHFQIPMEALEGAITERTAAVIVNSPNNPAGTVYSRQTLERLAALLRKKAEAYGHPIYVLSDEPYRELAYGVEVPFLPLIYPDTVVCYSYSKSLSLPGERIGYIYVPKACANAGALYTAIAGAARGMGHVCAPSLMQKVVERCAGVRPDLEAYDRNRRVLYEGLTAMGYRVAKPEGAFYLFVEAPGGDANAFSEKAKQKDLLLVPGDGFGCPGWFRICYCVDHEKILRSLPVFRALIEE